MVELILTLKRSLTLNDIAVDAKAVAAHIRTVELSLKNYLGVARRAVGIRGYHKGGKSLHFPFVSNVVHECSGISETPHVLSPLARVDSANQKQYVDQEKVSEQTEVFFML